MPARRPARWLATRPPKKSQTKPAAFPKEVYQRLTPHEHVLARPGMYIGSPAVQMKSMWLYDDELRCMVWRNVRFNSGLYKIFDEILVNALDNRQRDPDGTRAIDVEIDDSGRISVRNNGRGIPVRKHATEDQWVPQMIMGELHTGSNFDDSTKRTVGGRHGYGAKLTNIFSSSFEVDTADASVGQRYVQQWHDNMRRRDDPAITPLETTASDYTRVSFLPDYSRFGLDGLSEDMRSVMHRRVLEAAACAAPAQMTWQGAPVPVRSLRDLIELYAPLPTGEAADTHLAVAQLTLRWQVGVCLTPPGAGDGGVRGGFVDGSSFVNGVTTPLGGTHVRHVSNALLTPLRAALAPRLGVAVSKLKPADVAPHLMLFVNCLVDNPEFDSQAKERLSLPEAQFGGHCQANATFVKQVIKLPGLVERVAGALEQQAAKSMESLAKGARRSPGLSIPKLDDAELAGTARSGSCTLIVTEGDSAKALAVAGLEVVGRQTFGIFPVRGKPPNVREMSVELMLDRITKKKKDQAAGAASVGGGLLEMMDLMRALGLQPGTNYAEGSKARDKLRYGQLMLMTDQDEDGSHIKGLLISMLHRFWPELLEQRYLQARGPRRCVLPRRRSVFSGAHPFLCAPCAHPPRLPGRTSTRI